jgi:nicotinate-nucleotide adenylyltransferase
MKLGVFGGTFDPPHVGHLIVAEDVAAALKLDRVIFIPTGTHPLKGERIGTPAELRVQMIAAATSDSELFVVDDRETFRPGLSYTIDTIHELRAENPEAELYLLVGSDILSEIHQWHRVEELVQSARLVVMSRGGADADPGSVAGVGVLGVSVTDVAISSSDIRDRVRTGRPYRYLVPGRVYQMIVDHSLYRE